MEPASDQQCMLQPRGSPLCFSAHRHCPCRPPSQGVHPPSPTSPALGLQPQSNCAQRVLEGCRILCLHQWSSDQKLVAQHLYTCDSPISGLHAQSCPLLPRASCPPLKQPAHGQQQVPASGGAVRGADSSNPAFLLRLSSGRCPPCPDPPVRGGGLHNCSLVFWKRAWQQPPSKALEPDPLYRVKETTQNTRQPTRWGFHLPLQGLLLQSAACCQPACLTDRYPFETVSEPRSLILESLALLQKDGAVPFLFRAPKGGYDHGS